MPGYVALLRDPSVAPPFVLSVLGRVPIATAPLGLLLLVRQLRDSYELGGYVTGAFAVGLAVGSPWWGRGLDRFGHPRVVAGTACVSASVLVALTAAVAAPAVPPVALVALAALAGLFFPPLSPAMRATWRVVVPDERLRRRGYALDAVAVETIFVAGPLLLTALLAFFPPVVPLLVTALLMAGGGVGYSLTAAARAHRPHPAGAAGAQGSGGAGVVLAGGMPWLLGALAAMSVGFGLLDVSMAGLAEVLLGSADDLGVLFAGVAGGSAVGGLLYGSRSWASSDRVRLPVTLGGFGVMLAVVAGVGSASVSLWVLLPVLFVTGLFIAPNLIAAQSLVDALAPAHRLGEAQAWLSTSITAGGALGNALAGVLIARAGGPQASLLAAGLFVLGACGVALLAQGTWRARAAGGAAGRAH